MRDIGWCYACLQIVSLLAIMWPKAILKLIQSIGVWETCYVGGGLFGPWSYQLTLSISLINLASETVTALVAMVRPSATRPVVAALSAAVAAPVMFAIPLMHYVFVNASESDNYIYSWPLDGSTVAYNAAMVCAIVMAGWPLACAAGYRFIKLRLSTFTASALAVAPLVLVSIALCLAAVPGNPACGLWPPTVLTWPFLVACVSTLVLLSPAVVWFAQLVRHEVSK